MILIAIDPGASGGISIRYGHTNDVEAHSMPATPKDVCDIITLGLHVGEVNGHEVKAYMEEVGGFVGGIGQPGSAMFSFGQNFGRLEGFLIAQGIPFELVRPQKWQKAVGLIFPPVHKGVYDGTVDPKEERKRITNLNAKRKRDNKNLIKERAQRLYPNIRVTLDTSDSLMILHYATTLHEA